MEDDRRKYQPLIDLDNVPGRIFQYLLKTVGGPIKALLGVDGINDIHYKAVATATPETLWSSLVKATGVHYEVASSDLDRIPLSGPVVVVSNHPLGGLDGIILGDILHRRRKDSRLMANFLLKRVIHSEHQMFFVDPFPRGDVAIRASMLGMRDSFKHLKQGGLLGIFPGNKVSHYQKDLKCVADGEWIANIATLIRRTGATVIPVFIDGENSRFFSLAGRLHPLMRTVLLPRELLRRAADPEPVRVHVGTPIPFVRLKRFEDDKALVRFLRVATYVMGNRPDAADPQDIPAVKPVLEPEPVADKLPEDLLQSDVDALPPECHLMTNGEHQVYCASFQQLPHIMQEIGRGRELAFRFAGGGTLKPLDLSAQDEYYQHVFVWHSRDKAVVGAYRLGRADDIIAKYGVDGLICTGLFDLKPDIVKQLNPGLELGRSYVLPDYMKSYNSLMLLWAGILQYIARNPRYRTCFGSVGISQGDEYTPASRTLMVDYIREHLSHPALSLQVESRSPFFGIKLNGVKQGEANELFSSVDDVSALVTGIEPDGKGVPMLIKHYARLNAKLLSFGVWTNHSNAVVSFMMVDLTTADPKFLKRYMGEEGYANFMAYHNASPPPAEPKAS